MQCFAIKNGYANVETDVPDLSSIERFYDRLYEKRNQFLECEYKVEISNILNIAARKGNIDIIKLLINLPKINKNSITKKRYYLYNYWKYNNITWSNWKWVWTSNSTFTAGEQIWC